MDYKDYYQILGVSKGASEKEIKLAYRKLAREHHPDKNPGNKGAEEQFKSINEAYEVLGKPENRAKYDRLGSAYHQYERMGGNPDGFDFSQWFSGNGAQGNMFGGDAADFSSFFSSIFGSGQQSGRFGRQSTRQLDIEQAVTISLEEAFHGASRAFTQNGRQFTAKIPAGTRDGSKIRLRGKGNSQMGQRGDLFLVVTIKPHDTFTPEGSNLKVKLDVDDVTAVLGGQITVPTLTGSVTLTIPAGTQGGQTIRLKGKGMPRRQKEEWGDLLATVKIRVPKELTVEEKQLYEQLAQLREQIRQTEPI
jgi:curved DNA-binding protein